MLHRYIATSKIAMQRCNIAAQLSLLAYDFTYLLIAGFPDVGELVYLLIEPGGFYTQYLFSGRVKPTIASHLLFDC